MMVDWHASKYEDRTPSQLIGVMAKDLRNMQEETKHYVVHSRPTRARDSPGSIRHGKQPKLDKKLRMVFLLGNSFKSISSSLPCKGAVSKDAPKL